jgi:HEAT repeat protein
VPGSVNAVALLGVHALLAFASAAFADGGAKKPASKEPAPTLESLSAQLREPEPDRRRSAVLGLAKLATPPAWRLVLGALADPESAVGDEAELAAGGIADGKVLEELLGRGGLESRDERVALRAAEALGRVAVPIDGEALARKVSARDGEAALRLVGSIERLALAGRLEGRLERIAESLEPWAASRQHLDLSCAALLALAAVDETRGRKRCLDALRDSAPERRCAALAALARSKCPEALGAGVAALSDADPRVRMAAVECLDAVGTRAAMLILITRLATETRLRVRWRIVGVLQGASGLKHRLDPRPWKLWAEALPEGDVLRPKPDRDADRGGGGATRAGGFAGLQIVSDRVAFLFDFSGSMWTSLDDGRLPKDIVAAKLRLALESLPESTEFNLIPFTNEPIPWEEEVQPAKKAEVKRALEFFDSCQARGRGNFYDAALLAMSDPQVDTIVVLTDGVPTGGLHSDMDLIVPLLCDRFRWRKVVVDSILVDAPGGAKRRWEDLSRRSGGRCIEVDLGAPEGG